MSGGAPVTVCDTPDARGGAWGADGWIVFAAFFPGTDRAGLLRVPSAGGTPTALTTLADGEVVHGWPQVLPGGNGVLFSAHTSRMNWDDAKLVVQPLPSGERKIVQSGGSFGKYLASGRVVYLHDAKDLCCAVRPRTPPSDGSPVSGVGGCGLEPERLGAVLRIRYRHPGLSEPPDWWHPSGRILAFQETRPQASADLMYVRIEGDEITGWRPGTVTTSLSTAATEREPMFSPDGKWVAYQSNDLGQFEVTALVRSAP